MNEKIRELMILAGYATPELASRAHKLTELVVQECVQISEQEAKRAKAVAYSEFVTVAGRQVHQGMWAGAKNCSEGIQMQFRVKHETD